MAMVSAIQQAQKDNLRSFNDHMLKVLEVSETYQIFHLHVNLHVLVTVSPCFLF